MLAFLFTGIAILGFSLGALVLRSDPARRDSRFFAMAVFLDAIMALVNAAVAIKGNNLTDLHPSYYSAATGMVATYLITELAYSFPFNESMPRRLRVPLLLYVALNLLLGGLPATRHWYLPKCNLFFFLPSYLLTLRLLYRNYRRVRGERDAAGIPIVMLALVFRWTSSLVTYLIAARISPTAFSWALHFEVTVAALVGYLLVGYALLRYRLFRVRGVVAEVVLYGGALLAVVGLLVVAVDSVMRHVVDPFFQRMLLVAVATIPVLFIVVARPLLLRMQWAILGPIDPRRALAREVSERALRATEGEVDIDAMLRACLEALNEVTRCGHARFLSGPAWPLEGSGPFLSEPIASYLSSAHVTHLLGAKTHGLPDEVAAALRETGAELLVPVAQGGVVYGAFATSCADLDREAVSLAETVAHHLALKMENYALFARMIRMKRELDEAQRLATLGKFAAAIAHDIRTPLTSVQMNVQMLRGKAQLPPDDMECFDIALHELRRLNEHVTEILDYAKPVQLTKTPVDLRDVVEDAARTFEPLLSERSAWLAKEHGEGLPQVIVDPHRLRQVLWNLLDNATKASPKGASITVRTRCADGGKVALEVADPGKGIPEEHLPRIFEPFFTTRPDGTGLGLAIVQKVIRAHGGEVFVRSTVGHGSTFTILLPGVPGGHALPL